MLRIRRVPAPPPVSKAVRAAVAALALAAGLALSRGVDAQPPMVRVNPAAIVACVARAEADAPSRSGYAVLACPGRAAQACIAQPGQDNTVGMVACLDAERRYWDTRLNAAYARRLAAARKQDAEMASIRATVAAVEPTLRTMQRTWIAYRDAACRHEQAQWMGGTGGGPATMACHLQETARQTLLLEGWWRQ